MKVRVPVMIKDPSLDSDPEKLTENLDLNEDFFLDGPVAPRVAILDFDAVAGVPFVPPARGRVLGMYNIADRHNIYAADFMRVNTFATVLRTMRMYEDRVGLGRQLRWAFGAPQLLVVPRAGDWANAYYERDSHSLQFFYFRSLTNPAQTVYTCLGSDIVAHETAHAILDGIAPGLYDAITPQALALHEAIADLTAIFATASLGRRREIILVQPDGSVRISSAFSSIGEEFGRARGSGPIRQLDNDRTIATAGIEPHDLSEVLSGALYSVMGRLRQHVQADYAEGDATRLYSVSGKAQAIAAERLKRMVLRALDYLPPGEASFADYGRAVIAADQVPSPDDDQERSWIVEEFVRRGIVTDAKALKVEVDSATLPDVDLDRLVHSDWAAYDFANRHRNLLRIPADTPFEVEPRLDVTKTYIHRGGIWSTVREFIFKVRWDQTEPSGLGSDYPDERLITVGTTLAIDWENKTVRLVLTSDNRERETERRQQSMDRDQMLLWLVDEGTLRLGSRAFGPDGRPLASVVTGETIGGRLKLRGAMRLLHIAGEA